MKRAVIVLLTLLLWQGVKAQSYQLVLRNDVQVSNLVYEFDIYINGVGTSFELAQLQPIMTHNTGMSSGTVTFTIVSGTSELNALQVPTGLTMSGNELRIAPKTPPGSGSGTVIGLAPGVRVGRFRLTSSVPFTFGQLAGVQWKSAPASNPITKVWAYVGGTNTEVTNPAGHVNELADVPLPITLASFTGHSLPNGVELDWTTLTEVNNYGFEVQKSQTQASGYQTIPNSFIPGHGTTNEPHSYSYVDNAATTGSWFYRLKQTDLDGTVHYSEGIQVSVLTDVKEVAPLAFVLNQNYPNPFNPQSEIKFSVEATGHATLQVYNIAGELVATLFDDVAEAGQYYHVHFGGSRMASGVYFYRLQSGTKFELKKMLLLK